MQPWIVEAMLAELEREWRSLPEDAGGILSRAQVAPDVLEHLAAALSFYEKQRRTRPSEANRQDPSGDARVD